MQQETLPSQKQEQWADMEMGVIIHQCMEIYHPSIPMNEWKCSADKMPCESFAPTNVDTDQWLRTAAAAGAKYAVYVTNHVTGFSMWPTKENAYSIASSPYQDGNADIIRMFIESCKKYHIKPGLYYSTGCNGYYEINDSLKPDYKSKNYQEYVSMVERQLSEIWGNYGELFELWFDGGVIPHSQGGPDVVSLINKYQPDSICFQGPKEHSQNLRWIGNEAGETPINCWSTSNNNTCAFGGTEDDSEIGIGNPDGTYWIPAETDMGNRKQEAHGGGWSWAENESHLAYTPEHLLHCYKNSVGRNTNFLLGMGINTQGAFEDEEQFISLGTLIKEMYQNPICSTQGTGNEFRLDNINEKARHIIIQEDIHYGERVRSFAVDVIYWDETSFSFEAECIGHKRIIELENKTVKTVTLTIKKSTDTPIIKNIVLYK